MSRGVRAAGVYLPRYRVTSETVSEAWGTFDGRGIEAATVPSGDEDAVTMAIAAARRALANAAVEAGDVATLAVATTTPPLAEEGYAPRVATALGLPADARTWHHGQHTAAGADAMETALNADGPAIAIAADAPAGDPSGDGHGFGAGAAAFVVGADAPVEVTAVGAATGEAPGVRFREAGSEDVTALDITEYERTTVRETVRAAVADVADAESAIRAAAVHQPNGALPYRIAGEGGLTNEAVASGVVANRVGDLGAATVPVGLVAALESDGAGDVLAAWFGSGSSAVAIRFDGTLDSTEAAEIGEGETVSYADYLRKRGVVGDAGVAGGGANVSLPNYQRTLTNRYARTAGRCGHCGALSFPGEGACDSCHRRGALEQVPLAREGTVRALTVIGRGGAPPEFAELQTREGSYGAALVSLPAADGDGAALLPAQLTDCDPTAVEVGDPVRATVRRVYSQEGVPRYGAKFVPR
jgi:3-hydroxy-3-methylglutaryl CoA synthase/uncharacterized OB-fold protein